MKKIVVLFVILLSCLFLNSCKDNEDDNKNDEVALNEYKDKMALFDEKINNANDLTMDIFLTTNDISQEITIKVGRDPIIVEIISDNHKAYEMGEDNIIYEYSIYSDHYYKKPHVIEDDELINISDLLTNNYQQSEVFDSSFSDLEIYNFKSQDNAYYFETYFSDLLSNSNFAQFEELLQPIQGQDADILEDIKNTKIRFETSLIDNVLKFSMSFQIHTKIEESTITIPFRMVLYLKYNQNNLTDFSKLKYIKPLKFDGICDYTDFSNPLKVEDDSDYVGKFEMSKGVYYVNLKDKNFSDTNRTIFTIYDNNKNVIKSSFEMTTYTGAIYFLDDSSYFYNLEYDGTYYFKVHSNIENEISFVKLDKTIEELAVYNSLETQTIILENQYDVKLFENIIEDEKVFAVKNNSEYSINFGFLNDANVYYDAHGGGVILPGATKYINAYNGKLVFSVSYQNKDEDVKDVKIPIEVVEYSAVGDIYFTEVSDELLTEEQCVFVNEYSSKYMLLKLSESKIIKFNSQNNNFNINFYDKNDFETIEDYYIVPAGEYIIKISNENSTGTMDYIYYSEVDFTANKVTEDFEATVSSKVNDYNHKFAYLKIEQEGVYSIECESGTKSFKVLNMSDYSYFSYIGEVWCYFEPGEYLISCDIYDAAEYKIKYVTKEYKELEEVEVELVYYNDLDFNPIFNLYNIKNLKVKDEQVVKYWFTLNEDSNIVLNSKYIIIYDSEGNQITFNGKGILGSEYNTVINLEKGRYYFTCTKTSKTLVDLLMFKTIYDGTNIFSKNLAVLNNDETLSLEPDRKEKLYSYYMINIEEDGTYLLEFNNMNGVLFDDGRNEVTCLNDKYVDYGIYNKTYNLKKGKYYVEYIDFYFLQNATVKITKQN